MNELKSYFDAQVRGDLCCFGACVYLIVIASIAFHFFSEYYMIFEPLLKGLSVLLAVAGICAIKSLLHSYKVFNVTKELENG